MTAGRRNEQWKRAAIGAASAIGSALETGLMMVLWVLVGLFPHDGPSGSHRGSPRRIKGGSWH